MAQSSTGNRTRTRAEDETQESVETAATNAAINVVDSALKLKDDVSGKLKSVGVDTDVMVDAAKEQVSDLQRLLMEEMRARPMRALGVAAAVGLFVGLMTAR
jgi:ElaB/YqjD/DUF883 family membrane-anchored ribosome-binding protein